MGPTEKVSMCPDWTSRINLMYSRSIVAPVTLPRTEYFNSVAKDRGWFSEYKPIKSIIYNNYGSGLKGIPVIGICTVELQTKRAPHLSGRTSHGVLVLRNVLFAPSVFCNILSRPWLDWKALMDTQVRSKSHLEWQSVDLKASVPRA